MAQQTFPEIESMTNLKDVNAALRMGYNCRDNVKEWFKPELEARLTALELRRSILLDEQKKVRKGGR